MDISPARHLVPKPTSSGFHKICRRGGKRCTKYEECSVDHPYPSREGHSYLIILPNGGAERAK